MDAWREGRKAYLKKEPTPVQMANIAVHPEIPNEKAAVGEIYRELEDQYWDKHLAIGYCQQPKKLTQGDGGSQQKLGTARGWLTCHAILASCKGHGRQGPSKDDVQGAPKQWTFVKRHWTKPRRNNCITNRDQKQQLHLGSKGNVKCNLQGDPRAGYCKENSQVIHQELKNQCQDIVEGSASSEMKEETFKAQPSEKTMVVNLDELAPYQGTARDDRP
jgi:hypothetical protein